MSASMASEPSPQRSDDFQLPVLDELHDLTRVVEDTPDLYVRWSRGPEVDLCSTSVDRLTGAELPGLSANPLAVEPWWGDRPTEVWLARRLYDYRHLGREPGVGPWVLVGEEVARGPDNEPIVRCVRPVAKLGDRLVDEATQVVEGFSGEWGPLERDTDRHADGQEHRSPLIRRRE